MFFFFFCLQAPVCFSLVINQFCFLLCFSVCVCLSSAAPFSVQSGTHLARQHSLSQHQPASCRHHLFFFSLLFFLPFTNFFIQSLRNLPPCPSLLLLVLKPKPSPAMLLSHLMTHEPEPVLFSCNLT